MGLAGGKFRRFLQHVPIGAAKGLTQHDFLEGHDKRIVHPVGWLYRCLL